MSDGVFDEVTGETTWREQAYEDQYWAEKAAVSTWSVETQELFLAAVAERAAVRAHDVEQVKAQILAQ